MTRHGDRGAAGQDSAPVCFNTGDGAVLDHKTGDFTSLDDVDTERGSGSRIAPCHRVVPHCTGAALQQSAVDWKSCFVRVIQIRQHLHDVAAVEQLRVDAVQAHDVAL